MYKRVFGLVLTFFDISPTFLTFGKNDWLTLHICQLDVFCTLAEAGNQYVQASKSFNDFNRKNLLFFHLTLCFLQKSVNLCFYLHNQLTTRTHANQQRQSLYYSAGLSLTFDRIITESDFSSLFRRDNSIACLSRHDFQTEENRSIFGILFWRKLL